MRVMVRAQGAAWVEQGVRLILEAARRAVERQGCFRLVLAGGQSPAPIYQALAASALGEAMPWRSTQLFWGDERCVPPHEPASNYGQCRAWLGALKLATEQVHPMDGALSPPQLAADLYERQLCEHFQGQPPSWDLLLLGMGGDGHVASLFPNSPALGQSQAWVMAVEPPPGVAPALPRITLTLKCLNQAREMLLLVGGQAKAAMVARALDPGRSPAADLPASLLRPAGSLTWLLDAAAASALPAEFRGD